MTEPCATKFPLQTNHTSSLVTVAAAALGVFGGAVREAVYPRLLQQDCVAWSDTVSWLGSGYGIQMPSE